MANRVVASVLLAAVCAVPAPARAAELVLHPVRTLVYDLAVSVGNVRKTKIEERASPAYMPRRSSNVAPPPAPQRRPASGEASSVAAIDAKGSIVVDVMAATADGGLVVDFTESATGRNRPKVRFAITGDGQVAFDPKEAENVTPEELALARWLARGFFGEHPTDRGTEWTNDQSNNGLSGAEHYRVTAAAESRVTLEFATEEKSAGAASYGETRQGSLVYDTVLIVPVRVSYQGQAHRDVFGAYDTTLTSVTLTLRSDTFAKKR
jgi:hypothetical protein